MNTKDLKIFAMYYVMEHDDLLKEEKLGLIEFIKEASEDQVKFLLITGEVMPKLVQEDIDALKEAPLGGQAWKAFGSTSMFKDPVKATYKAGQTSGATHAVVVAAALFAGAKAYKRFLSKAARACKEKGGVDKTRCMQKFKLDAKKAKIAAMQKGMSACSKTKDPSKCKAKLQGKIAKEKASLGQ